MHRGVHPIRAAIDVLGLVLVVVGLAIGLVIPADLYYRLVLTFAGMFLLVPELTALLLAIQVEKPISHYNLILTDTSERNWENAVRLVGKTGGNSSIYDVSSYRNQEDFAVLMNAKAGHVKKVKRIVCFNPSRSEHGSTLAWFRQMLDPSADKDGKYNEMRSAMSPRDSPTVEVLHLPDTVFADFLVCDMESDGKSIESVVGLLMKDQPSQGGWAEYTKGYVLPDTPTASVLKEMFDGHLWQKATGHFLHELDKKQKGKDCCMCVGLVETHR